MTTEPTTAAFSAERDRLLGLAYRMLGSAADAEDVLQDTWLRWDAADHEAIARPAAWLTTVATRLAIDRMRAQQRRREAYVGPWLPEPISLDAGPEEAAELSDSLTMGFLTMLDTLTADDRAVYLLSEVFGQSYRDVAATVGRSEEACRQVVSRARRRLRHATPVRAPRSVDARRAADAAVNDLLMAIAGGDVDAAMARLAPEAVLVSDAGPSRRAARRPVVGPFRIARLLDNLWRRLDGPGMEVTATVINGEPGMLCTIDGELDSAFVVEVDDAALVSRIWVFRNPDKLAYLAAPVRLL